VRATSANKPPRPLSPGFTLLEIMIALGLVAILTAAAIPYLYDSFASGEGDRLSTSITERVASERTKAIQEGRDRRLTLRTNSFAGNAPPYGMGSPDSRTQRQCFP